MPDSTLDFIFGKVKFRKDPQPYDMILFFLNGTRFDFSLALQFSTTGSGQANGIISAFFMRAAGKLQRLSNDIADLDTTKNLDSRARNLFIEERFVIRILTSAVAFNHKIM